LHEFESCAKLTYFPDLNEDAMNSVQVRKVTEKKSRHSGRDPLSTKQQNNKGGSATSLGRLDGRKQSLWCGKNKLYLNWCSYTLSFAVLLH